MKPPTSDLPRGSNTPGGATSVTGQTLTTLNQRRQETAQNRPCRVPPGSAVLAKTLGLGLAQLPHGPWLVCALRNTPSPALPPKIQGLAPHTSPGPATHRGGSRCFTPPTSPPVLSDSRFIQPLMKWVLNFHGTSLLIPSDSEFSHVLLAVCIRSVPPSWGDVHDLIYFKPF